MIDDMDIEPPKRPSRSKKLKDSDIKDFLNSAESVVGMHLPYAFKTDETRKVQLGGVRLDCKPSWGMEYVDESGGVFESGYPFSPYQVEVVLEKVGDDERFKDLPQTVAYLVDARGILWIYSDNCLDRPCLGVCLNYVRQYDPHNLAKVLEYIDDPRYG